MMVLMTEMNVNIEYKKDVWHSYYISKVSVWPRINLQNSSEIKNRLKLIYVLLDLEV